MLDPSQEQGDFEEKTNKNKGNIKNLKAQHKSTKEIK